MNFLTAKQSLSRKLDIDYTKIALNGLFSDTDLGDYIQQASNRVWGLHPWPFTQGAKSTTTINSSYYDVPLYYEPLSTFSIIINNNQYKKWEYQDYVLYFQQNPTATDFVFAEYAGYLFVNQNSYTVGMVMDTYGKLISPQLVNTTDELPFTSTDVQQDIGNEAIIEIAYSIALKSDKLKRVEEGEEAEKTALGVLQNCWKPIEDARTLSQRNNRPMFNVPNLFNTTPPNNANNLGRFF